MPSPDIDVLIKPEHKVEHPKLWAIRLYNDDFTPMDFVVIVLVKIVKLDLDTAAEIMLQVHNHGSAKVGRFTKDIAETKVGQIMEMAQQEQHPLRVEAVEA